MSIAGDKRRILNRVETRQFGANALRLTCPQCGGPHWKKSEDGWTCVSCGEFVYPENMGVEVIDAQAEVTARKEDLIADNSGAESNPTIEAKVDFSPAMPSVPATWSTSIMGRFMRII